MTPCRTLMVEDSSIIAGSLTQALEEMTGLVVVGVAATEDEAVRHFTEDSRGYDLVIVDIFLKAGSGLGVLRRGRVLMPGSTFVVVTNYATPEMRRACTDLGAAQIFDKSTQLDELIDFCRQVVSAVRPPTLN